MNEKYALVKVYSEEMKPLLEILDLGRRAKVLGHKDAIEWRRQVAAKFRCRLRSLRIDGLESANIIQEVAEFWAHYIAERDVLGPRLTEPLGFELRGMLKMTDKFGIERKEVIQYRLDNFGV